MKHIIKMLENEIKTLENVGKNAAEKKRNAEQQSTALAVEAQNHGATIAGVDLQKSKLQAAIEGIKEL